MAIRALKPNVIVFFTDQQRWELRRICEPERENERAHQFQDEQLKALATFEKAN